MNKSESKYFHTAVMMDNALISLLEQKELPYISVKEICEKAGVNRSTFYLHYESVAELLEEATQYIYGQFLASFGKTPEHFLPQISDAPLNELILINDAFLRPYLNFVKAHTGVFRAVFNNPECMQADWHYAKIKQYVLNPILDRFHVPKVEQDYMICYYIHGTMAIIQAWIRNDCREPVDKLIGILLQCVRPESALSDKELPKSP